MVEVNKNMTIIDLTIKGLSPGTYHVTVREGGNINLGADSTGSIWGYLKAREAKKDVTATRGYWGTVKIGSNGYGSTFMHKPIGVLELFGKSIAVSKSLDKEENGLKGTQNDPDTLVGVIARSAGVWDNDKTVCSCSGKTVWEERKDLLDKGML